MLDSGFGGNFVQKQIWHHLFRPKSDSLSQNLLLENDWGRTCEWNNTKRKRWTHSKCCPETVPNAGKRTKPQFLKMTCITCLIFFWGEFFHYPLPLSGVISSFLFLRNTCQFFGRHSKCDVWRVSHHWQTEKHGKTNVSKGNPLSVHSLCGSAAPSKLLVHFCTKAVRNPDFQVKFGFGLWWLHFLPFEMFTGAITFKH